MRVQQLFSHLNIVYLLCLIVAVKSYSVRLSGIGSVIAGGVANYSAVLYDGNRIAPNSNYNFNWKTNLPNSINEKITTREPYANWTVHYPKNTKAGFYRMSVEVDKEFVFYINIAKNHADYEVRDALGGDLDIYQDGKKMPFKYVSTANLTNHTINLSDSDLKYLANATYVNTYWFQNCTYLGMSNDMTYVTHYNNDNETVEMQALVVGSFEPLPEPLPSTTTTTTSTTTTTTVKPTTTTTTTTTSTTTTKPKPTTIPSSTTIASTTANSSRKSRRRRDGAEDAVRAAKATEALLSKNNVLQKNNNNSFIHPLPKTANEMAHSLNYTPSEYNCVNRTVIARDDEHKVYGYFSRIVVPKHPLSDFKVSGKNWLQHGDLLNLQITFKGSSDIFHCIKVFNAPYNSSGNESCEPYRPLYHQQLNYHKYFSESKTVLFFIRNDVSEIMNQVTITIYEAKVQPQLSVVVVPVSFTLVAVILVVFGVSFYIQSRNRFTVEVADFNFGETQSTDLEYKTFQQRLIDSIRDVMPRRRRFSVGSDDLNGVPDQEDSNLRYNTLT